MNTDDLRAALQDEAERQPAVSPAFDAGIAGRVRRQRALKALALIPVLAVVVLGAALVMARGSGDATVQTADGGAGTSVAPPATSVVPDTKPRWKGKGVDEDRVPPAAPSTEPSTTAPPTTSAPGAAPVNGACGTVTIAMTGAANVDTAPFTCFLRALDAGVPADLTVVVTGPEGGQLTDRITTDGPGRMMTVSVEGSMSVDLPDFSFGSGGGPASGDAAGSGGGDCGTTSVSISATGAKGGAVKPDTKAMQCLANAFLGGQPATLILIVQDQRGGAIDTTIDLSTDHRVTVTSSGSITLQLPEGLRVPEDLINAIPPGVMGLNAIPGLSGFGGLGVPGGGGSDPAADGPPR